LNADNESGEDRIRTNRKFTEACADLAAGAAKSAADELEFIVHRWPTLPASLRKDIVALACQHEWDSI
jgi:hypothetical protein